MFTAVAEILGPALSIWEHKEANKYRDEYAKLLKEHRVEINKPLVHEDPEQARSDAAIDDLTFRLRVLGRAYGAAATGQNA